MNKNLNELIKRYTIKHDRKIKKIGAPLTEQLKIPTFAYFESIKNKLGCSSKWDLLEW